MLKIMRLLYLLSFYHGENYESFYAFSSYKTFQKHCRCRQKVNDAKAKRELNIKRQVEEQKAKLEAINGKLAAGIARRNYVIRSKQLRSLAACRWCAARRIQQW